MNEANYFFVKSPLIYHVESRKSYFIRNEHLLKRLLPLLDFIGDARIEEGVANILLRTGKEWFKEEYDLESNHLIRSTPLHLSEDVRHVTFFNNTDDLFVYSVKTKEVLIKRLAD